jgi:hypothetical protein
MQNQSLEQCEHFACLTFAGTQLLIPQTDIYSLEPTVDMIPTEANNSVGQLELAGTAWTLYALSADLTLLNQCPDNYHIAILLKNQPLFGLLCEQIASITRKDLSIHTVPTAMQNPASPLLALALINEQVRYISSAQAISRLLVQES